MFKKAEILAQIELFYLLPNQRRWKRWFPEIIHYKARLDVARKYARMAIEDKKWESEQKYQDKVLRQLDLLDLIEDNIC